MVKISVVINTFNEEQVLTRVLASVKNLADEIVVVDMGSTDNTVQITKKFKAKVYAHKKVDYVEPVRNFAISKATGDWILILDPDEEVSLNLAKKLEGIVEKPDADYYRLPRKNIIFDKWIKHSRWWPDYNIRFFKKGKVVWSEIIHSVPETHGTGKDLEAAEENAIIHHHYQTIDQYVTRLNRYTTEHAKLLAKDGYKFSWQDLIKKPTAEFVSRYFAGEGYKDGVHGLALAFLQTFSELVLYLKTWELEKFGEKELHIKDVVSSMKEAESDVHYWQADALVKNGGGFVERIKRKFKLP